jgi:hypothetical protein
MINKYILKVASALASFSVKLAPSTKPVEKSQPYFLRLAEH